MNRRILQVFTTLLQSDVAARLAQNEALMSALMRAFSMSVELRHLVDARLRAVVEALDVARGEEVEALRREIEDLRRLAQRLEGRISALEAGQDQSSKAS